jgi:hypothetical protein
VKVRQLSQILRHGRWVIAAIVGGIAGWALFSAAIAPVPAVATACVQPYNVVGWQQGGGMHRGDRVQNPGMFIWGNVGPCVHISTLDAYSSAYEQAESGWINMNDSSSVGCFDVSDSHPHNFYAYVDDSFQVCKQSTSQLTAGTWAQYAVQDTSADHHWFWFKDGTQQWGGTNGTYLSYLYGDITANGERHGSTGSAEAHFTGLQYDTVNGWGPWDNTALFCDTVDNWDIDIISNTEIHVYSASNIIYCPI